MDKGPIMLATKKRNRRNRKASLLQLEQLEDRRVFNASWHGQLVFPAPAPTEVFVIVVTRIQAPGPADLGATAKNSHGLGGPEDRKSTRLNSSHANISYAVF